MGAYKHDVVVVSFSMGAYYPDFMVSYNQDLAVSNHRTSACEGVTPACIKEHNHDLANIVTTSYMNICERVTSFASYCVVVVIPTHVLRVVS